MSEPTSHPGPPPFADTAFDVVALAASAGGLRALCTILKTLPGDLPAAVVVVQHLPPHYRSMAADILGRCTTLRVKPAESEERLKPGNVYVAPPDYHLLVTPEGRLSLSRSARVHFVRPAADILFESAAASYGARLIAVVLSGSGRDGAEGVGAVKDHGGIVIVQDPESCDFSGMPSAALSTVAADFVLPLEAIAEALARLTRPGEAA